MKFLKMSKVYRPVSPILSAQYVSTSFVILKYFGVLREGTVGCSALKVTFILSLPTKVQRVITEEGAERMEELGEGGHAVTCHLRLWHTCCSRDPAVAVVICRRSGG